MKKLSRRGKERESNQKAEKEREAHEARARRSTADDLMWGDEGIDDPPRP